MKISVVVTCYNIEAYIGKCLDSLINQTLQDIEFIVVDDGSTDKTADIINEFKKKDKRIKTIIFKKNTVGGVGSAANAGLEASTGEYIAFADGDDWYEEDMYQTLYSTAKKTKADLVISNYTVFDQNSNCCINPSDFHKWKDNWTSNRAFKGLYIKKHLLKMNPVPWRKLYKRSLLEDYNIRFPIGDFFYEDNPFHWKCIINSNKFAFVNKILCYHRVNRQGQTMSATDQSLLTMYQHHDTIFNWLKDIKQYDIYLEELIEWLIANTEWISNNISEKYYGLLFEAVRNSILKHNKREIVQILNNHMLSYRGRFLVNTAISNKTKLFINAINFNFKGMRLKKAIQAYKEKGFFGLIKLHVDFIIYRYSFFKNIKIPFVTDSKRKTLKKEVQLLAKDIDEIKRNVDLMQASLLFLLLDSSVQAQSKMILDESVVFSNNENRKTNS